MRTISKLALQSIVFACVNLENEYYMHNERVGEVQKESVGCYTYCLHPGEEVLWTGSFEGLRC